MRRLEPPAFGDETEPFMQGRCRWSRSEIWQRVSGLVNQVRDADKRGRIYVRAEQPGDVITAVLASMCLGWEVLPLGPDRRSNKRSLPGEPPKFTVGFDHPGVPRLNLGADTGTPISGTTCQDDFRLLVMTSGTTGEPNLVSIPPENLFEHVKSLRRRLNLGPETVWLDPLPVDHLGGFMPLFRCWLLGGQVCIPEADEQWWDPVRKYRVTGASIVPVQLRKALEDRADGLGDLEFIMVGGDRASPELIRRSLEKGYPVLPTYGMTEATSTVAVPSVDWHPEPDSVGRPLNSVTVTIVDEDGKELGTGEEGNLVLEGPVVVGGRRVTSDRGFRDDEGRLYIIGREEDRIVSGGVRLDRRQVERDLEELPGVREVAVVGLEDEKWGQRPGAVICTDQSREGLEPLIGQWNRDQPAARQLDCWRIVQSIPRTETGTVQLDRVRDRLDEEN